MRLFSQKEKHNARKKLKYAIQTGKLKRLSCEYSVCTNLKTEAHHADYNYPLDVIWLCRPHHLELHSYNRSELALVGQ